MCIRDRYTIVGNHTAYYKNNNSINSIDLLLREYNNIITIPDYAEYTIGDTKCLFIGWMNEENRPKIERKIKSCKSKVCFGHLELNGYAVYKGFTQSHGASGDADIFNKFERVYTGHYHTRSTDGTVYYLGNPYEMFWNDCDDTRGFHIWDSDTYEATPVNNPHRMFHKIYYKDTPHQLFDATPYAGKILKVIVEKRSKPKEFEKFLDKLNSVCPEDLKVIESVDWNHGYVHGEQFDAENEENTITLLNRFIEEAEVDLDKGRVKELIGGLYNKACEVD